MTTKLCERCKRRIKAEATTCLCGWSASGPVERGPVGMQCCYSGCSEGALCRVWTRTGWANVCVTHYGVIEILPRPSTSQVVLEIRKAYLGSLAYNRRHDAGHIAGLLPKMRDPGSDDELGIPLDDLERELADRLNP